MATVAVMVGGALLNAFSFSGSNFLFSMFGNKRVDEERKRHDLAIEQLQSARDQWAKKRTERIDYINETLKKENRAAQVFKNVDEAMKEYYLVTGQNLEELEPEPKLSDYYKPSEDQKTRELVFVALGIGTAGLLTYKLM